MSFCRWPHETGTLPIERAARPVLVPWAAVALLVLCCLSAAERAGAAPPGQAATQPPTAGQPLSPYWGPGIQQWAEPIGVLADGYGFHPDFIAAVIQQEIESVAADSQSPGTLPISLGSGWQPSAEAVLLPAADLRWGIAILSYVVQQSGGDLFTALAAYRGGWSHVNDQQPREFAARVLDSYGRALITRDGLSPSIAGHWTVAVEIRAGNVPADGMMVLGGRPIGALRTFAEHVVYAYADAEGRAFYVRGYAIPLSVVESVPGEGESGLANELEAPLRARLGEKAARGAPGNPRVLLACLPSLSRLRGQTTTRWYAPSNCPRVGR